MLIDSLLQRQRSTFSVLAIFRNEAHILSEWCQHYQAQGASRIYLINHLSTDNYLPALQPFIDSGFVELVHAEGEHPQIPSYNALRSKIRRSCRWILVCDLDEFAYARNGLTLKSYLKSLPWDVSEILIPWKNFGSSNHHSHPKGLVTKNFTYRWDYDQNPESDANSIEPIKSWCKYIVRTSRMRYLAIHFASVWIGRIIDANGNGVRKTDGTIAINEDYLRGSSLHLNHYGIQSKEYFESIKMRRPDVNDPQKDKLKSSQYFRDFDRNEIHDPELSISSIQPAPPSGCPERQGVNQPFNLQILRDLYSLG